jgi:hypothetical protein
VFTSKSAEVQEAVLCIMQAKRACKHVINSDMGTQLLYLSMYFHNNFRSSDVLCLQTNHGYRWRSLQSDQDINTSTPRMINDLSVCRSPPCTFLPFILGALHRTTRSELRVSVSHKWYCSALLINSTCTQGCLENHKSIVIHYARKLLPLVNVNRSSGSCSPADT